MRDYIPPGIHHPTEYNLIREKNTYAQKIL